MPLESKIKKSAEERSAADPNKVEMPGNGTSAHEKPSYEEIAVLAFEYYQLRERAEETKWRVGCEQNAT